MIFVISGVVKHSPIAEPLSRDSGESILLSARTESLLETMSLEVRIGQMFVVDLRSKTSVQITELNSEIIDMIDRIAPGGILLFGANIDTIPQTVSLVQALQGASRVPLFIGVDYEGGRVSRLTTSGKIPATRLPASALIGKTADPGVAYRIGRIMGAELRSLGMNMNFAPVADILSNADSMIGDRAFSDDPRVVAAMTGAMVRGIQDEGVSSIVKHFPGHGDTTADSHDELVVLRHGRERLYSVEFLPFTAAIDAGVDGIMTAHIAVPEIGGAGVPTTFSRELITEELRKRMGHQGLVITDSLTMRAVRSHWDSGESAVRAILAGADMILQPFDVYAAKQAVIDAVTEGHISESRIEESLRRILRTKMIRRIGEDSGDAPYRTLGSNSHASYIESLGF